MIKCANKACEYYNQELNDGIEVCPKCNEPTVKTKQSSGLGVGAVLLAIVGIFMAWFYYPPFIGMAIAAGSIVLAFISKSKPAVVITIIALVASVFSILRFSF